MSKSTFPTKNEYGELIKGGDSVILEAAHLLISVGLHKQDYFIKTFAKIGSQKTDEGKLFITERQYDSIVKSVERHYDEIERGSKFLSSFLK